MRKLGLCLLLSLVFSGTSYAQDATVNILEPVTPPAPAESQPVPEPAAPAALPAAKTATPEEMVAFFKGLDEAVSAHEGDCKAMSGALSQYYAAHQSWIDSLDFATVNADAQVIEQLRTMAEAFGKKLSTCYDEKSIPAQLKRYAK